MTIDKSIFVTCDLHKPKPPSVSSAQTVNYKAIEWIMDVLKELEIKAHLLWKSAHTEFDVWLSREHTPDILETYLSAFPNFLQSASCVVGWELPTGLCRALESQGILWVSFSQFLWSPREDILCVHSSDLSLLKAIHHPHARIQPTWKLDDHLRLSSLLIVEPPKSHYSRIRNGKVFSVNDYVEEISELAGSRSIYVFPRLLDDTGSPTLILLGLHSLRANKSLFSVYISSGRVLEVASLDPSVAHIAESFQKPFHTWNNFHSSSALISYRQLKSPRIWEEILNHAR